MSGHAVKDAAARFLKRAAGTSDAMTEILLALEWLITAPGRLIVWMRWAMPTSWRFHDAEYRDDRAMHWIAAIGFYVGVFFFLRQGLETGVFAHAWTGMQTAFASR